MKGSFSSPSLSSWTSISDNGGINTLCVRLMLASVTFLFHYINNLFDVDYITRPKKPFGRPTARAACAYICVETQIMNVPNTQIAWMKLTLTLDSAATPEEREAREREGDRQHYQQNTLFLESMATQSLRVTTAAASSLCDFNGSHSQRKPTPLSPIRFMGVRPRPSHFFTSSSLSQFFGSA